MLIAIIGENCVGKSTVANLIKQKINVTVYTGKDYLRLEKNQDLAKLRFKQILQDAVLGENIIYVISENEHLQFLCDGAIKILVSARLETIKSRFAKRMGGVLPAPLEKMLESRHGAFDNIECDLKIDGENFNEQTIFSLLGV